MILVYMDFYVGESIHTPAPVALFVWEMGEGIVN